MSRLCRLGSALFLVVALVACGSDEPEKADGGGTEAGQQFDGQSVNCGNGVLDDGEACDTAISTGAGACPQSCDDGDPCTTDELTGSGCNARCVPTEITTCSGTASDGCCPAACDGASDVDCGSCGNGTLDPGERCDTAIAAPEVGYCPTICDDGNACTVDNLAGTGCDARCRYSVQTQCSFTSDGCCPSGCDPDSDPDCSATCGNSIVDDGETCDTAIPADLVGACPTDCDDLVACTTDELVGSGCNVSCVNREIEDCDGSTSDGCCPKGCTTADDVDCKAECGNGVVDEGETCDTAIAADAVGACPRDCNDGIACTLDKLVGAGTCTASCSNTPISRCSTILSDGCCPIGCNSLTDSDCKPGCGNGVVDEGELCDTKIAAGEEGSCPTKCDDGIACTDDKLVGGGTCTAECAYTKITQCMIGAKDGCCPAGCSSATDADCTAECGNGVVDADETCDTKIPAGDEGACPEKCDDGKVCTIDTLVGGGTCTAQCSYKQITGCDKTAKDGCCPSGCNANTDSDCLPVCGNGVVESGEYCDTKIPTGQKGACPTACDDGQVCTIDTLEGTACAARCTTKEITDCDAQNKDECCPDSCNANTDADCSASCGNGELEDGELCDTGITDPSAIGYCPRDVSECDDGKVCTADSLDDNKCQTQCVNKEITTCGLDDKCCPANCNANNDSDCDPVCGNGVVESGELCDIGISDPTKPGYCPKSRTDCDDKDYCTTDIFSGDKCTATCDNPSVTRCVADGCCLPIAYCPKGTVDPDCGSCPTAACGVKDGCCPTKVVCSPALDRDCCNLLKCSGFTRDGCCPAACTFSTDIDCLPFKG